MSADGNGDALRLDEISTRWSQLGDPVAFCLRYAQPIRAYLAAIIDHDHDADDVAQEFLARIVQQGFPRIDPDRGRFRDYLKRAVRNAALTHLRRPAAKLLDSKTLERVAANQAPPPDPADVAWIGQWRSCLLDQAWRELDRHQQRSPGNLFHTVLQISAAHPDEDSEQQAARASAATGQPLRADAFRKQRSRAREMFATVLCAEVSKTLDQPTRDRVEEELAELGLLDLVREYLPAVDARN